LKPSNTEKRLLGEVFTPLYGVPGCVEDQLNLIDESFWRNKNVKVLDPCAGIGNYPAVLVDKFMKGLVDEFPDPDERLKWILEKIIYVNEYQSKNLFIYLQLFDPDNKYKLNFNRGDYLKLDIKQTFGVDKFDLICSNPPYNDSNIGKNNKTKNLYNLFTEKAMKESDRVIFITPSRWFGIENMRKFRENLINNGLKKVVVVPDNIFGNVSIDGGISFFYIEKGYKGDIYIVDISGNKIGGILNNKIVLTDNIDIIKSILKKISIKSNEYMSKIYKNPQVIKSNDKRFSENGDIDVLASKGRILKINCTYDENKQHYSKYKVVFERVNGSFRKKGLSRLDIKNPNILTTQSICYIPFDTYNEAKSCLSYLKTKTTFMLRDIVQYDKNFTSFVFSLIPIVPFDREWTDEKLFEYFELNDIERNFILNYGKNR